MFYYISTYPNHVYIYEQIVNHFEAFRMSLLILIETRSAKM